MSTGHININLPNLKIDGYFKDGHIIKGKIRRGLNTYEGTYNSNSLLDGDNCTLTINNYVYNGKFISGMIIKGTTSFCGKIIETGKYYDVEYFRKPKLKEGSKFSNDIEYIGYFDKYGNLKNGKIINRKNKVVYSGEFENEILVSGTAEYEINKKFFKVHYVLKNNNNTIHNYTYCRVEWDGTLECLPNKLFMMAICSSTNSSLAFKFYDKYLSNLDYNSIKLINENMFNKNKLDYEDQIALKIIMENVKKYNLPSNLPSNLPNNLPNNLPSNPYYDNLYNPYISMINNPYSDYNNPPLNTLLNQPVNYNDSLAFLDKHFNK